MQLVIIVPLQLPHLGTCNQVHRVGMACRTEVMQMKTVLLTDDNEDIIELVKLVLGNSGYKLDTATDGAQAVARCLSNPPDLVLMDINMPTKGGFDAVKELRAKGFKKPIVMLTASESAADRKHAKDVGCDAYILKTLNMDDLEKVIDHYLVDSGGLG